jgi:hypothetical protein
VDSGFFTEDSARPPIHNLSASVCQYTSVHYRAHAAIGWFMHLLCAHRPAFLRSPKRCTKRSPKQGPFRTPKRPPNCAPSFVVSYACVAAYPLLADYLNIGRGVLNNSLAVGTLAGMSKAQRRGENDQETIREMIRRTGRIRSALLRAYKAIEERVPPVAKAEHTTGAWEAFDKLDLFVNELAMEIRNLRKRPRPPQ